MIERVCSTLSSGNIVKGADNSREETFSSNHLKLRSVLEDHISLDLKSGVKKVALKLSLLKPNYTLKKSK